jgi:hypothetical protein
MERPVQDHHPNWPNYVHPRRKQGSFWSMIGSLALAYGAVIGPLLLMRACAP